MKPAIIYCALLGFGFSSFAAAEADFRERTSAHTVATVETIIDDVKAELSFGKDVAARILGHHRLHENADLTRYVNLVGQAVALHAGRPELEFHFAVLDTESVNAYAAPGGYIFVTHGALANMQDEAELAAVLAHEIAHVNQKHIVKELRIRGEEKTTTSGFARLLGATGDPTRIAFAQAIDKAVTMLFESGLKQADELEADRVGTLTLANAGYDPMALKTYLERIRNLKGTEVSTLHATHPPFDARLSQLDALIAAEGLSKTNTPRAAKRFTERVSLR